MTVKTALENVTGKKKRQAEKFKKRVVMSRCCDVCDYNMSIQLSPFKYIF